MIGEIETSQDKGCEVMWTFQLVAVAVLFIFFFFFYSAHILDYILGAILWAWALDWHYFIFFFFFFLPGYKNDCYLWVHVRLIVFSFTRRMLAVAASFSFLLLCRLDVINLSLLDSRFHPLFSFLFRTQYNIHLVGLVDHLDHLDSKVIP